MSPDKNYPADRKYHPEHTWARAEEDGVVVGISYFAQDELGEVLFVELPEVGEEIQEGRPFGVVGIGQGGFRPDCTGSRHCNSGE